MTSASAWRIAGTSIAGPMHLSSGGDCQDRHRVEVTAGGALVAVVSDGAGSARFGGEGAALLCDAIVARLAVFTGGAASGRGGRSLLAGACRAVRDAVVQARESAAALGAERGVTIDAFHATLVGALVTPGDGGIFFHIGDGAALALASADGRWQMSGPRNGEYADTTYFFTEADWRRNLRFSRIEPGYDTIFVMTDGVTDLALSRKGGAPEPFLPFFEPIGRFLAGTTREAGEEALSATLGSEAARARTLDDKTLVWAQAVR